ncbi:8323_t:CDS:2, partial [Entrophospora sp. SA101]
VCPCITSIQDAGYSTPENNHETNLFVTDMEYTPKKEKRRLAINYWRHKVLKLADEFL